MRTEVGILILALVAGLLGLLLAVLYGFGSPVRLGAAVAGFGLVLTSYPVLHMARDPLQVREFVKQVAAWLGVVVLLPLSAWYGTSAFHPPPDWKAHYKKTSRLDERYHESVDPAEKEKLRQEKDRLDEELDEAERAYYGAMFWVAYPVGLVAIVVGYFFPVQAVGAGLMFGGLAALAAGCYSYWDRMGDWLRFGSLVLALVVIVVLATWRFRPAAAPQAAAPNAVE